MELQIRHARGLTLELNQSNISSIFEQNSKLVSKKLAEYKDRRDELNVKVRSQLDKRNEINLQVEQNGKESGKKRSGPSSRSIREQMNKLEWRHTTGQISPSKEKDFFAKMKRLQADFKKLKKEEEASSSSVLKEVRQAEKRQQKAHDAVTDASEKSEEAHSLMMELSNEVDRLRGMANSEHLGLTSTKSDADELHNKYIISLRCIHSMQDILKLSGSKKDHEEERVEVSDLMSRLMSGDTLSDEDMMLLQRN